MASQNDSDYELLTEHLGYPPVSLLDDIINTVNVLADRALDSVERLLLSIPPANLGFLPQPPLKKRKAAALQQQDDQQQQLSPEDAAKLEIESGTHKLETLLTASIDRNFDKLELYAMQNILTVQPRSIRPHVRLAHYADLDFSIGEEDGGGGGSDAPTVESVAALRRRLQASQRLNLALHEEKARNEALLRDLREVLGVSTPAGGVKREEDTEEGQAQQQEPSTSTFGFLAQGQTQLSSVGSSTPITTTTQFTLSQLQALRALSTSLRALLPDLSTPVAISNNDEGGEGSTAGPTAGRKTWRKERAGYVEASSRKYLENAGGLELGKQGEVRDGEYQGAGRALSKGDVEGLENAVTMLEKAMGADGSSKGSADAEGKAAHKS